MRERERELGFWLHPSSSFPIVLYGDNKWVENGPEMKSCLLFSALAEAALSDEWGGEIAAMKIVGFNKHCI